MKFLVLAVLAIGVNAGDYGYGSLYVPKTYGQTYDVKSDFYNDYTNAFDARHVPALYVPRAYSLEKSGYAPAAVYANNANGYAIRSYGHGYAPKTYGQTFDVKSDFYNDYSNAFNARHVPALMVPKVYAAEKSGYVVPAVLSNAAPAALSYGSGDLAYGKPVYGYGNKYAFNYEGDHVPNVVSGNYGDHGYVANLNHGYAPGYALKHGY